MELRWGLITGGVFGIVGEEAHGIINMGRSERKRRSGSHEPKDSLPSGVCIQSWRSSASGIVPEWSIIIPSVESVV
jgi:hypothetical protein